MRKLSRRDKRPGAFAVIPRSLLADKRVQRGAVLCYAAMVDLHHERLIITIRQKFLMEVLGKGRKTIQRYQEQLKEAGYLGSLPRDPGKPYRYYFPSPHRIILDGYGRPKKLTKLELLLEIEPWIRISVIILRRFTLSISARLVYAALYHYWRINPRNPRVFPGHARLANDVGMSKRTIYQALDELRRSGFVDWTQSKEGGSNEYQLKWVRNEARKVRQPRRKAQSHRKFRHGDILAVGSGIYCDEGPVEFADEKEDY